MINVKEFNEKYEFLITGATYVGLPKPNSVLFIGKKLEALIHNLNQAYHCLVFIDKEMIVPEIYKEHNCIVISDNPPKDYALVANRIWQERQKKNQLREYTFTSQGYWIGDNVILESNVSIQPGCFIDHDVVLGTDTIVLSGARISNAKIGQGCLIKQNAVIGGMGFTMSTDEDNHRIRIPSLGKVSIGNSVEIGSFSTICCGTGNDTVIFDYVKIDDHVHIGHDITVNQNVEIAAGAILGGYSVIGENCFIGLNTTVKNRIKIAEGSYLGMGSVVTQDIGMNNSTVFGNPARVLRSPN
jgi:UDP-3-O-[3-hydroxymyristoyl] glucosamine N-acyltransferase